MSAHAPSAAAAGELRVRAVPAPKNIKAAVDQATRQLPTDASRLDAEVLMAFVLGWSRAHLFAHWDEPLGPETARRFWQLVDRRSSGEPIAYIRNFKEFLGLDFYVDPRVLIPRPETELLVARALAHLQAGRASLPTEASEGAGGPPPLVIDVGTGSGAIAIGILKDFPRARVIATDISADALAVAQMNAERHGVRPGFRQGSLLEPVEEPIDLIVANLPYLSLAEYNQLRHTSIAFEPRRALTDEQDGLQLSHQLLDQAESKLKANGCILLEVGRALPDTGRFHAEVFADYAGHRRIVQLAK